MTNTLNSDVGHLTNSGKHEATIHSQKTIDAVPGRRRIEGSIAAAMLAPAVGMLVVAIGNFLAPVIERLGLRMLFLENGISNLAVVVALGSWLFTWVALYEAWHDRMIPRPKLYAVMTGVLLTAAVLMIPAVYRVAEHAAMN